MSTMQTLGASLMLLVFVGLGVVALVIHRTKKTDRHDAQC